MVVLDTRINQEVFIESFIPTSLPEVVVEVAAESRIGAAGCCLLGSLMQHGYGVDALT